MENDYDYLIEQIEMELTATKAIMSQYDLIDRN
jgi:hypothetical protein